MGGAIIRCWLEQMVILFVDSVFSKQKLMDSWVVLRCSLRLLKALLEFSQVFQCGGLGRVIHAKSFCSSWFPNSPPPCHIILSISSLKLGSFLIQGWWESRNLFASRTVSYVMSLIKELMSYLWHILQCSKWRDTHRLDIVC